MESRKIVFQSDLNKAYVDLISKKKESVNLPHFVGLLNIRMPGNCYAQAFIRQGKFLWNYGVKIEDDFDDVRKDLKTLDIESIMDSIMDQQDNELKLVVNEKAYKERQNQNEEENSTLKGEEVGDYNVKFDRVNDNNIQINDIPRSKATRKLISVSFSDEEEKSNQNCCNDEESSGEEEIEECECKVVVKSTKKCKKAYSQLTKSILRGVQLGIKRGIKDTIENLDFSFFDQTNKAVAFVSSQ